ncbi:cytochrome c family protein [Chitinophaga agrisoli]|uniref:Cytochrome c family protein n=1 Tax=Chitinophaga agrisoli TaxID=2607653 RepID=A0A5B2VV37_9BACT|nr:cytochrome c family protein [Chitinophaga agrisoli]KAA2243111.1 cytochrome c family protein [Chitinophaga agrisoli]
MTALVVFMRKRKAWLLGTLMALLVYLASASLQMPGKANAKTSEDSCKCGFLNIRFDSIVPGDSPFFINQENADCFGWWEFVTLNWPTVPGAGFGDPGDMSPVAWETYIGSQEMYPPNGAPPPPWGSAFQLPSGARDLLHTDKRMASTTKLLTVTNKLDDVPVFGPQNTGQAFPFSGPAWLGAQNNTNVWYEIKLNQDIYNFVVSNKYYDANYQYAAVQKGIPIVFPMGSYPGPTGAIELKAAWMEVPDPSNEKWKRYKLSQSVVRDAVTGKYRYTVVALVGLHIIHKTKQQRTWVWATFEHIDNVPGDKNSNGDYSFYNDNCQPRTFPVSGCALDSPSPVTVTCAANMPPPYYLCKGGPGPVPIQVTRQTPIDQQAQQVNAVLQAFIAKNYPSSVWQYYQLVNVIWSTNAAQNPQKPDTVPIRLQSMLPSSIKVANVTMETYAQTMSCTDCHQYGTIAPTAQDTAPNWAADFSFAIGLAQSPKAGRLLKRIKR